MNDVIPPAFAFRFSMPIPCVDAIPRRGKRILKLEDSCRLHWPGADLGDDSPPIDLRVAWNEVGLGIEARVSGKAHPPVSNPDMPDATDGLQIWIDTRNTQTIHRANRFCHQFCLLPNGGGKDGQEPLVRQLPIGRAADDAPTFPPERFTAKSETFSDGYRLEVWLPGDTLNGFDPEISPRLGFYAMLHDSEIGQHFLTVDSAFPVTNDPSLWQSLELVS